MTETMNSHLSMEPLCARESLAVNALRSDVREEVRRSYSDLVLVLGSAFETEPSVGFPAPGETGGG